MENYCAFSRDHKCILWLDYEITRQELEECHTLCHGNWIEIEHKYKYIQELERLFGTEKENHGFLYTQMIGKARMEMKVGLTFACMNLKKLAKMIARKGKKGAKKCLLLIKYTLF